MKPMALVAGGAGWLGRRLLAALVQGLPDLPELALPFPGTVRCLVRNDEERELVRQVTGEAECVRGDLRQADSLTDFTRGAGGATLFNCAGLIHPRRVRELYEVNVAGTRNLLQQAARAGVRRLVHVSSNSPFGYHADPDHRFDESSPYHPYMSYGRSKQQAELLVAGAAERGEIETAIVRPPWFYGPGQPARQTTFFFLISRGRAPLVGGGGNFRSMAYLDNICQGLLLCALREQASGGVYWIADRRPYTMREIVDTVAEVMAEDFGLRVARQQLVLPDLVSEAARWMDGALQGLGLYSQKIHVLSEMNRNIACSIEKARQQLGYEPTVELREGMRRSLEDLHRQGKSDLFARAASGGRAG